ATSRAAEDTFRRRGSSARGSARSTAHRGPSPVESPSEPTRPHPEALLPAGARRDALQFLVQPLLREVHRIRDAGHWLDRHEGTGLRRIDDRGAIARPEHDIELLRAAADAHHGAAVAVTHEIAKHIVQRPV